MALPVKTSPDYVVNKVHLAAFSDDYSFKIYESYHHGHMERCNVYFFFNYLKIQVDLFENIFIWILLYTRKKRNDTELQT